MQNAQAEQEICRDTIREYSCDNRSDMEASSSIGKNRQQQARAYLVSSSSPKLMYSSPILVSVKKFFSESVMHSPT